MPEDKNRRASDKGKAAGGRRADDKGPHKHLALYAGGGTLLVLGLLYLYYRNSAANTAASTTPTADTTGPAGAIGPTGAKGPAGAKGPKGGRGPTGKNGKNGIVTGKKHTKATTKSTAGKAGINPVAGNVVFHGGGSRVHSGGTGTSSGTISTHKPVTVRGPHGLGGTTGPNLRPVGPPRRTGAGPTGKGLNPRNPVGPPTRRPVGVPGSRGR